MKKLKLNLQNLEGAEVLTREQLKMVTGGDAGSFTGGNASCTVSCTKGNATVSCTSDKNDCEVLKDSLDICYAVKCDGDETSA